MRRAKGAAVSIEGVTGRIPVGAVLTIGTKGPSGAPTDRDRFYIKVPDSTEGERACHPSFGPYNTARCSACTKDGKADRSCPRCVSMRQTIRCVLVHASPSDCFEWNRKAQKIMGGGFRNHPKLPACTGDGKKAKRLVMLSIGNGKTLTLTQQAFLDCDGSNSGERYYSAGAVDSEGNEYPSPLGNQRRV